jgi:hypothetical protein
MKMSDYGYSSPKKGLAIAALVVGIISLLCCFVPVIGIIAIILAIVALIKKQGAKPAAIIGLILGILSTLISGVVVAGLFKLKSLGPEYFGPIVDQYYEDGTLPEEWKQIDEMYTDEQKDELIKAIDEYFNK